MALVSLGNFADESLISSKLHEFADNIDKKSFNQIHALGDLRGLVDWLNKIKQENTNEGFSYAYQVISKLEVLQEE